MQRVFVPGTGSVVQQVWRVAEPHALRLRIRERVAFVRPCQSADATAASTTSDAVQQTDARRTATAVQHLLFRRE